MGVIPIERSRDPVAALGEFEAASKPRLCAGVRTSRSPGTPGFLHCVGVAEIVEATFRQHETMRLLRRGGDLTLAAAAAMRTGGPACGVDA